MRHSRSIRNWIVVGTFAAFALCKPAGASTTTLAWTPPTLNTDGTTITNLSGYVVSYGTQSGSYANTIDVGNVTTYELSGLEDGEAYYATVQAYNSYGLQSDGAPELSWAAPDGIAPSISAPAQISLIGDENDQAVIPDVIAQATITDNLTGRDHISTTQDPTAGTVVGLGTTPVTLAATDEAGNTAQAIVNILVAAMNRPPNVNAGSDQATRLPQARVTLDATVTDDGLPDASTVSVEWSMASGPTPDAAVTFGDANALHTTATFAEEGTYILRLTATDGELTATDDVIVTVSPKPVPMPPGNLHARSN